MAISPSTFVTDSNIWIDLHHGGVTTEVFGLPYRFVTTDLIYEELLQPAGSDLALLGLEKHALNPDLIREMLEMVRLYPRPSRIDISGLVLARHLKLPLLSGDEILRSAAGPGGIRQHGTLFLLDKMVAHGIITPEKEGSTQIIASWINNITHTTYISNRPLIGGRSKNI